MDQCNDVHSAEWPCMTKSFALDIICKFLPNAVMPSMLIATTYLCHFVLLMTLMVPEGH